MGVVGLLMADLRRQTPAGTGTRAILSTLGAGYHERQWALVELASKNGVVGVTRGVTSAMGGLVATLEE
jgi:hypothetical protein